MGATTSYRSLTAEQKEILKSKRIEMERPVAELLALLKPLAAYDKGADKLRTKFGCGSALAFVFAFASLFVMGLVPAGYILPIAFVVVAVGLLVAWKRLRSVDLSNNLRGVALPLLGVIREDFDRDKPVRVKLDLSPPTAKEKKLREEPAYKSGAYHKVIDTYFVDPWMTGDGVLRDGTRLRWSIVDSIRERKKTKSNARGKTKTKTKYVKKTEIEVQVGLQKKRYELDMEPTRSDEKRNTVNVTRNLRTDSLDPISPNEVIEAVASVFRNARPAAKGAQ